MPGPRDGSDSQAGPVTGKVATDYSLTSLAAIKKFLSCTIGYDLKIPDNATGVYGKHVFRNGNLVSELASPCKYGNVDINKVERDINGQIRVTGTVDNADGQGRIFEAVLQENRETGENGLARQDCQDSQGGQVQWRAILARVRK